MSYSLTLQGRSSTLEQHIDLELPGQWSVGVLSFHSYNSIPNVTNAFIKVDGVNISIPTGSYEISSIESLVTDVIKDFELKGNRNTLHTQLKCSKEVELSPGLAKMLGFKETVFPPNILHVSDNTVDILPVSSLRLNLNIADGAYINNKRTHVIYEFSIQSPPGYQIIETPPTVVYHPINRRILRDIELLILDQNGKPVDFRSELVTVRLHLKNDNL